MNFTLEMAPEIVQSKRETGKTHRQSWNPLDFRRDSLSSNAIRGKIPSEMETARSGLPWFKQKWRLIDQIIF